ncbi:four helix bundle protein [Echinicola jeungdonensis]|uniref:Four helix bundle protein n=1 Tax=Echinicola jeungdonensis TaxID=709343 RepID=A0ABV5J2T0_9BACT|nr:four helix bundle protein [Echinicola jeungdonensis]MDN3668132.1 four helix bundle protein [Echinicola jeungdonensis]
MSRQNIIIEKTFAFSEKILDVYFFLRERKHYRLAEQIVGAGTSIGANVEEAQSAHSRKDFISKMVIAAREARESRYWLKLFNREELLKGHSNIEFLLNEIDQIISILNSIIKSSRE